MEMNNLLYISYGTGLHEQEVVFSMLTAWKWVGPDAGSIRYLILTDHPENFAGTPATIEHISAEQWRDWAGPSQFSHRRKILALRHTLRKYGTPTALLDADTWMRKSPQELFKRIAPGRTLMHIREARIRDIATPQGRMISDFLIQEKFMDYQNRKFVIPTETVMWNAGVLGFDPADIRLLDNVLHLTDQMCVKSNLHILEQTAFSYILAKYTSLSEAYDIVFHYWPPYLHLPFKKKLPSLMRDISDLPLEAKITRCYAVRPRPGLVRKGKVMLKRCLQAADLLRGRSRSNEW